MKCTKYRIWDMVEETFVTLGKMGFWDDGELWYVHAVDDNEQEVDPPYFVSDHGKTWKLMQFTGKVDIHGVDIYEDDIVIGTQYMTTAPGIPYKIKGVIKYSEEFTTFYFQNSKSEYINTATPFGASTYSFEVIGNIHQDKRLMEVL